MFLWCLKTSLLLLRFYYKNQQYSHVVVRQLSYRTADRDLFIDRPIVIIRITSASVELTQTRHSHSKQLFHGGQISRGFYRELQKATYGACKRLFLAVAEI